MMGRPQIGTVTEDGKVTVSLGYRAWITVIGAVVVATSFVIHTQLKIAKSDAHVAESAVTEAKQDSTIASYRWRLSRLERKTGISRRDSDRRGRNQRDD